MSSNALNAKAPRLAHQRQPTRTSFFVHALKVAAFRGRRFAINMATGPAKLASSPATGFPVVMAESVTPLWSDETIAERALQIGKVENLKVACSELDGRVIPAGAIFSFWRNIGRPSAGRGFTTGRALQLGCMVPSVGGGLCQLSNALYDVALQAGCRIVERHPHSRAVPGSTAAPGRDATVAWNYVDLRFAPTVDLWLSAELDDERLNVRLWARQGVAPVAVIRPEAENHASLPSIEAQSCASCDETDCFLHENRRDGGNVGDAPPRPTLSR